MADSMWDDFDTDFDKIGGQTQTAAPTAAPSSSSSSADLAEESQAADLVADPFGGSFDFPLPAASTTSKGTSGSFDNANHVGTPVVNGAVGSGSGLDDFFEAAFDVGGASGALAAAAPAGAQPQSGISTGAESQKLEELERTVSLSTFFDFITRSRN